MAVGRMDSPSVFTSHRHSYLFLNKYGLQHHTRPGLLLAHVNPSVARQLVDRHVLQGARLPLSPQKGMFKGTV